MKNLEQYYINANELKTGDKLYSPLYGELTFVKLNKSLNILFPLLLNTSNNNIVYFTKEGRYQTAQNISLFKSNPFEDIVDSKPLPRVVEVRDTTTKNWVKRILITDLKHLNSPNIQAVCYDSINKIEDIKSTSSTITWKYFREINQITEITKAEAIAMIADKLNKNPDQIEII